MRPARPRRTPALVLATGLALAATVAVAPGAGACSCGPSTAAAMIDGADAVFVAEPVSSRVNEQEAIIDGEDVIVSDGSTDWTLTVREVLIGDVEIITEVHTPGGRACGSSFEVGVPRIVVADDRGDGLLTTRSCVTGDDQSLRAAALAAGHEPHEPLGVPAPRDVVVGAGDPLARGVDAPAVEDPVEDELVLIRGLAALVAVLLAIAIVSVLVRDDAD